MRFSVLGPLRALRDGRPVVLRGHRERRILAGLLTRPNGLVTHDRLVRVVWDDPPATARRQLQNCVWQLRRQLHDEVEGERISGAPEGYQINVDRTDLDALVFDRLLDEARRLRGRHQDQEAIDAYDEALSLWRGAVALDGVRTSWIEAWAAKLDERRICGLEERVEVHLRLSHHQAMASELTGLVAEHPLRERLVGQLMVALYRGGRQADALREYQQLAHRLAELGLTPNPHLGQLQVMILRNDAALEISSQSPGHPRARSAVAPSRGAGPNPAPLPAVWLPSTLPDRSVDGASPFEELLRRMRQAAQTTSPRVLLPTLAAQVRTLRGLAEVSMLAERVELLHLAARYAEFTGWMAQEAGDDAACLQWTRTAVALAEAAGDGDFGRLFAIRQADIALYDDDPARTLTAVAPVVRDADAPPQLRRLALERVAQGSALIGRSDDFHAALVEVGRAHRQLAGGMPVFGSGNMPDPAAIVQGWGLVDLGSYREAAHILDREVLRISPAASRARARYGVRRLLAHVGAGHLDAALELAPDVLDGIELIDSATIRTDLRRLRRLLARWYQDPTAAPLTARLTEVLTPAARADAYGLGPADDSSRRIG
ncbi:BTAD domain-containing putative transcriptional regulator [Micromonospora sp. CA-246542]|uniref:BTAD domain-containing putative transcriptional regulator n=1 Tax=Micromonospora sp. CA-246542 TaxID=3239959 RepID=UPI003D8AB18E